MPRNITPMAILGNRVCLKPYNESELDDLIMTRLYKLMNFGDKISMGTFVAEILKNAPMSGRPTVNMGGLRHTGSQPTDAQGCYRQIFTNCGLRFGWGVARIGGFFTVTCNHSPVTPTGALVMENSMPLCFKTDGVYIEPVMLDGLVKKLNEYPPMCSSLRSERIKILEHVYMQLYDWMLELVVAAEKRTQSVRDLVDVEAVQNIIFSSVMH